MNRARSFRSLLAIAAVAGLALTGCAAAAPTDAPPGDAVSSSPATETTTDTDLSGKLTIYAAASLQRAFDEISTAFETAHPGVEVAPIVYDGSSTLVTQLSEGAAADVFASADEANMEKAVIAELATDPAIFATNSLVVATPVGNPGEVTTLTDLADPEQKVVLCAPEVPCGAASTRLLEGAGLVVTAKSFEQSVTAVLTKIAEGVADAGLVYRTDAAGRDDVESFTPEGAADVVNRYPITALSDADAPDIADAFVEYVQSTAGQAILAEYGFGAP